MDQVKAKARNVKQILGLQTFPVGIRFIFNEDRIPREAGKLKSHRYCQALMKARHGGNVLLKSKPRGRPCLRG